MLSCYKCSFTGSTIDIYITHLRLVHPIMKGLDKVYSCRQGGCIQKFTDTSSLRRHLKSHLTETRPVTTTVSSNTSVVLLSTSGQFVSSEAQSLEPEDNFPINLTDVLPAPNSDISSESLFMLALRFTLTLCSYDFLSRKHIFEILSKVKSLTQIISPFISNTNIFLKNYCNDPFKAIDTEHKFLGELKKMNLFTPPTRFVIEKSLTETFVKVNPVLTNVEYHYQICFLLLLPIWRN